MDANQAIWITGLGTTNPLGSDYAAVADNLLAGKSGVVKLEELSGEEYPCRIVGRLEAVPVPRGWDPAGFAAFDRLHQLVLWCTTQALVDAGYWDERSRLRI